MKRRFLEIFECLARPFEAWEVKTRTQTGRSMDYITARTAMNRLDSVVGPADWWDEYEAHENSVYCRLTLRMPDGSTLTKCDAGGFAGMADSGDDDKSGYSDAFKRAAVKFGIARYLYKDGVPDFRDGEVAEPAREPERAPGKGDAYEPPAAAPSRPAAAPAPQPARNTAPPAGRQPERQQAPANGNGYGEPRTGKALFAWCKSMEQKHEVGLLKYINGWAKLQEFPARMIEFDERQVGQAYREGMRKLQALTGSRDEAYEEALSH